MLRRTLQRLVRLSPRAARRAWQLVPRTLQAALSVWIHPIAVGPRRGATPLRVELPARAARTDVVVADDARLLEPERARLLAAGHHVIDLGRRGPDEIARAEAVIDAILLSSAAEPRAPFGWRVARAAIDLERAFPEVTIVIPTHAARELCESCIASVLRSTAWERLEIVVIDDGSSDGTEAMLERLVATGAPLASVRFAERRGFAAACNEGLRRARGEYVALLNDDTVVAPGWLSRLVAHLERDPKLGLIGPVTNQIGNQARIDVDYHTLEQMERFARERTIEHAGERSEIASLALFCAVGRREVIEAAGGLDERFRIGMFEDDDLSARLKSRGFALAVARDAFVHHVGQATFGKLSDAEYLALWEANKRRFEQKWGRRWRPPQA